MQSRVLDCDRGCSRNRFSCSTPRAKFFSYQPAKFKGDKGRERLACVRYRFAENLISCLWLFEHTPYLAFCILQVSWGCCCARFTGRDGKRFQDMHGLGHERRAKTDEEMRAKRMRVSDPMRDTEEVAVILARKPCSDEGP